MSLPKGVIRCLRSRKHAASELITDGDDFTITKINLNDFLTFYGSPFLVCQDANDLMGLGVDCLSG